MSHDTLLLTLSDSFIYRMVPYERIDRVSCIIPLVFRSRNVDRIASPGSLLMVRTGRKRYFSLLTCFIVRLPSERRHRGSEKWNEARTSRKAKRDGKVTRRRKQPRAIAPSIRLSIRATADRSVTRLFLPRRPFFLSLVSIRRLRRNESYWSFWTRI